MNVLLVDDNQEFRGATRELLEVLGHRVTDAASAEEALRLAPRPDLELLLTDLSMPGIDGVELTERLLGRHPDLAVLLTSSDSDDPRLGARVGQGDVALVAKPFSAAALRTAIDAAVAAKTNRSKQVPEPSRYNAGEGPRPPARLGQPAGAEPGNRNRPEPRISKFTVATLVALVTAAAILILEPGPPELPVPPAPTAVRGTEIELVAPVGPIAELPAAFSWRPVAAADRYRLTVREVDDRIVWHGEVGPADGGAEAGLELPAELARRLLPAVAYTWNVTALDDAGGRIAWSGRIRFRVLPRADGAAVDNPP